MIAIPALTAFSVLPEHSGYTFTLAADGAAISLPPVAASLGCYWRFIMGATNNTNPWVISSTSGNIIQGVLGMGATAGALDSFTKVNAGNVDFTITAEVGDWIDITSDGVRFYVRGMGGEAASFA